ncbi:N-6 DNA methylase [Pontiellaceae bacterium B1224]|nr:N-6 DNA methylase [Pontiellaceae bacterium B1224]
MKPLEKTLRNQLERTIKAARDVAEAAAAAALEQLGVGEASAFGHLSDEERELRRKLRVHGRQLGDERTAKGGQRLDRLVEEVAYEHWHRMLFARFLAENNLLMYPDPDEPVAVTLEECDDLAADEGASNGWELAARYAARMLPQIFRPDSPVFKLTLPPEHQQKLEQMLSGLALETFIASDSLGWVYQFWQAKRKDEVNASEVKIGARELPAVTQLFTEDYMVSFLLDNSLGAWWAGKRLTEQDYKDVTTEYTEDTEIEQALRERASIPGVPLEYLRFVPCPSVSSVVDKWMPAAGTFDAWPEQLCELKTIDPSCGSGHFLVAAFLMLVPMRMELDGLSAQEAVDAVLRENIHGLELDQRCVELAAFALALTAWKYPDAGGYRPLPELQVACSGLSISAKKDEWLELAADNPDLAYSLEQMYNWFSDAPVLGSLLNPKKLMEGDAFIKENWSELRPALQKLIGKGDDLAREMGVVAHGLAKVGELLMQDYAWVITNVPYLKSGKQGGVLKTFCEQNYRPAKADLATVFLDRCLELCGKGGSACIVLPQNWLFLTTYRKFREKLLNNDTWHIIARLGSGAFETISGEVVKAILISISRGTSEISNDSNLLRGVDVSECNGGLEKAANLLSTDIRSVSQAKQLKNPDCLVSLEDNEGLTLLNEHADGLAGILNGDSPRFLKVYWEMDDRQGTWSFQQTTQKVGSHFGGMHNLVFYDEVNGHLREERWIRRKRLHDSDQRGQAVVGKKGVAVSSMGALPASFFTGSRYDSNVATVVPRDPKELPAIWSFCSSKKYNEVIRQIDQSLKVTNATLVKVPFDIERWTKVAEEKYPNGLPKPYSDDPTQWIFHGHPCGSVVWNEDAKWTASRDLRTDDTVLQVAVARLLGYRWPAELDEDMELADEQWAWVERCEALLPLSDEDGIVCIPPVRGEAAADGRLLNLLAAAYGDAWSNDVLAELLKSAGHAGKSLESWLRDKFFAQHCKLFQHRPFIWQVWDGLSDGFSALVNYHKLDYKLLETLTHTYLGDWIIRCQEEDRSNGLLEGQDGEKTAAAKVLKKKLELILKGEAPHDIFVRWKPLDQQPIGWNPDLNDGVRMNIRPFMTVGDVKKKGAGILRDKPNIKWTKDRGQDVPSAPWYHLGPEYGGKEGDRINDHHLSLEEKSAARNNG